jgi:hypothetical protein
LKQLKEVISLGRSYAETISRFKQNAEALAYTPETNDQFAMRLYRLNVEWRALQTQIHFEDEHEAKCTWRAYDEEVKRVEEECRTGRELVRERLLKGIEERRRKAREEKDGEGTSGSFYFIRYWGLELQTLLDTTMEQSRPHATRKLRNKVLAASPPPTPPTGGNNGTSSAQFEGMNGNPTSLSIDELPSPFPLPLTMLPPSNGTYTTIGGNGPTGRRKAKGTSGNSGYGGAIYGGLGKAIAMMTGGKEIEIESDLGEIRRGTKRRRQAVAIYTSGK